MSFFQGLKEIALAGVDGWVDVETAKNQNKPIEQTAPKPGPDRDELASSPYSSMDGIKPEYLLIGGAAILAIVLLK